MWPGCGDDGCRARLRTVAIPLVVLVVLMCNRSDVLTCSRVLGYLESLWDFLAGCRGCGGRLGRQLCTVHAYGPNLGAEYTICKTIRPFLACSLIAGLWVLDSVGKQLRHSRWDAHGYVARIIHKLQAPGRLAAPLRASLLARRAAALAQGAKTREAGLPLCAFESFVKFRVPLLIRVSNARILYFPGTTGVASVVPSYRWLVDKKTLRAVQAAMCRRRLAKWRRP